MRRKLTKGTLAASAAAAALVLASCSSGGGGDTTTDTSESGDAAASGDSGEQITLTVATFNDFGYTDELLQEYMDENPHVTVVHNRAATSDDARANYFSKLGSGGLADIEAVEVDWLPEVMEYADLLSPVPEDLKPRWLDWKVEAATDSEGNLIGYGTDIGPEAVCYRMDLFEEAGLPSEPDAVAELLDGDWANYFSVGDDYVAGSDGKAFYDSAGAISQGMFNQVQAAFEDPETGEIIATTNPEVKDIYDELTAASATQSAKMQQWSDDWFAGMANGNFATTLCPGWFLGIIEGNAPDIDTWNIANVFPNGGGNWGGSYLTIPANGANVEAAGHLADWLTSPETQAKAFANVGAFPSQVEALSSPEVLDYVNPYFNDAPVGKILAERADAVTVSPFKGPDYFRIMTAMQDALNRVENGSQDATTSWDQFVSEVDAMG